MSDLVENPEDMVSHDATHLISLGRFKVTYGLIDYMSHVTNKPACGVSDQVQHKLGWTTAEDGFRLKEKRDRTIYVAKTKALINCVVTAQLICAIVSAYAKKDFLMTWLIY